MLDIFYNPDFVGLNYSANWNIYLVYIVGVIAMVGIQTFKKNLILHELSDTEIYDNLWAGYINEKGLVTSQLTYWQIFTIPLVGLVNDVFVLLGAPYFFTMYADVTYNAMWFGQFIPAENLLSLAEWEAENCQKNWLGECIE